MNLKPCPECKANDYEVHTSTLLGDCDDESMTVKLVAGMTVTLVECVICGLLRGCDRDEVAETDDH
jgi:hypothetical protein